jgi:hypothetical protein
LGMYQHALTGEYRLLLYLDSRLIRSKPPRGCISDACYVFVLGSNQPPRHIGWAPPDVEELKPIAPVLFLLWGEPGVTHSPDKPPLCLCE